MYYLIKFYVGRSLIVSQFEGVNVLMCVQVDQKIICESLLDCVLCKVHKAGPLTSAQCSENCTAVTIEAADAIEGKFSCCEFLSIRIT